MTLYHDKLKRRSQKVKETKLLKKFDPTSIIIEPIKSEKAWWVGEKIETIKVKVPERDKNWNVVKEEKVRVSKAGKEHKKMVVKTKVIEKEIVKYTFLVSKNANKNDIKEAICKLYGIKREDIVKVNTMRVPPKYRAIRWLVRKPFKKAIVTLKPWIRLQIK